MIDLGYNIYFEPVLCCSWYLPFLRVYLWSCHLILKPSGMEQNNYNIFRRFKDCIDGKHWRSLISMQIISDNYLNLLGYLCSFPIWWSILGLKIIWTKSIELLEYMCWENDFLFVWYTYWQLSYFILGNLNYMEIGNDAENLCILGWV